MRLRARPRPIRRPRWGVRSRAAGLLLALLALPAAGQERPSSRADYRIVAHLDGDTKRIQGDLELRWTNASNDPVRDLWFHLYLNAFSNNRSTHLVESDGKLRGKAVEDGWGWSRVSEI